MESLNNLWKLNKEAHDNVSLIYDKKHTEIYNEIEQNRLLNTIGKVLEILKPQDNINVLDFGSGTGNLTLKFLSFNCLVTASDVSEKSLSVLSKKTPDYYKDRLKIVTLTNNEIPFPDNYFDVVATYSVLHHIPDYLFAVQEMMRVTKPGGIIFIDHEANENKYNTDEALAEYYRLTKLTLFKHIRNLIKTKELFTYSFLKTVFIKLFINSRYEREGDIHVWADDHIEWNKIIKRLKENYFELIVNHDFLLFNPNASVSIYEQYKDKCNDTKYIIARKIR